MRAYKWFNPAKIDIFNNIPKKIFQTSAVLINFAFVMKDDKYAIVVGRQYGSGGRIIAKMLAARLGVKCYDMSLMADAAEQFGFDPEIFIKADEKRPSRLRSLVALNYGATCDFHDTSSMCGERLYEAQSEVIRRISGRESCVIVGRTADYVLRDMPRCVSIFLHAPLDYRADRVVERGEVSDRDNARNIARRRDKDRESYYNYYTGRCWGKADNYDLSLQTSLQSAEETADILENYVRKRLGLVSAP